MQTYNARVRFRSSRSIGPLMVAALISRITGCATDVEPEGTGVVSEPVTTDTLELTAANWRYFYRGPHPVLVAGPGGPEDFFFHGARLSNGTRAGGDQQTILDWLNTNGGDALYGQAVKSHGGDGIFANGIYPACPRLSSCYKYANPFRNGNATYAADPQILDQWYAWLSSADAAGIITHLFLYDDSSCPWFGAPTGGRIASRAECRAQTALIPEEDARLITPLVNRFKTLKNIVWVVGEEYSEVITTSRASAIATRIRALDPTHPIAVHLLSGSSYKFASDPNVRVSEIQLGATVNTPALVYGSVVKAYNTAAGRYAVMLAESAWQRDLVANGDRATLRHSNWAAAMAGAAGVLVYGMWEPTVPDTGMLGDLRRLESFFETTNWEGMSSAAPYIAEGTDHARSGPDGDFILYSDACALGASLGYTNVIATRDYDLEWFDPIDGSTSTETRLLTAGSAVLRAPAHLSGECAVWVH